MFDLDAAFRAWRGSFGEELTGEHLDELEEHLRAQVAELTTAKLSQEEAFLVATRRLGHSRELETEFAKVHAEPLWIARIQWMILGFLGVSALVIGMRVVTGVTAWGASMFDVGAAGSIGATALVQVLGLLLLVWIFFRVVRSPMLVGRRLVHFALALALLAPVLTLGRGVVSIMQARTMSPEAMGYVLVHQSYVAVVPTLILPIALAVIVFVLERRRRTA